MNVRVVYRKGSFVPQDKCELQDGAEGLALIASPELASPTVTDPAERRRLLAEVVADMERNPIPQTGKKLTRDQMHERD
jgi:hypothetical protein